MSGEKRTPVVINWFPYTMLILVALIAVMTTITAFKKK